MGKNKGPLLESRVERTIEVISGLQRQENWVSSGRFHTGKFHSGHVGLLILEGMRLESITKGFDHFEGSFDELQRMIVQVLFLREQAAAALATGTKKRRQRKPSPPVEDLTVSSRLRKRRTHR